MKKGWLRHLDFIFVDFISTELSIPIAFLIMRIPFVFMKDTYWALFILIPLINIFSSIMLDSYNKILQRGYFKEAIALLKLKIFVFTIMIYLLYFLKLMPSISRAFISISFLISFILTYILRFLHKFYLKKRYNNIKYSRQIMVITTTSAAKQMLTSIQQSIIGNFQFFGLGIIDQSIIGKTIENITVSADKDTLITYIKENVVDEVFIDIPDDSATTLTITNQLLEMGITVHIYMEDAYQTLPNRSIGNVFGYNVLTTTISPISFHQSLIKRFIDIVGSIVGCILCVIIAVIIGPIIYLKSPGPIFFSQIRVGKKGRHFKIYKFRSMYMDAEERKKELMNQNKMQDNFMFKMDNDPRIIKGIGNFIRRTSLDEFPQFWNVLKGDMSLVGTRPPTIDEYQHYSPHHQKRLSMLPGITGLWQISGRSNITNFEDVVRLDTEYIENWSLELDIKILLKTFLKIMHTNDAY